MSNEQQYPAAAKRIGARLPALGKAIPSVLQGFQQMAKAANVDGALDNKTKELIALALGVAARCEGCLAFHAKALVELGATRAEVEETMGVAIYMGGGPSLMYATEALAAFDEFSSAN
ncbi:MAG: carboxymuconolactone decarboxylase family protein [Zoogloeaceae bacterium]|jgi:AhpD family alkylhydroperoxidase|nr:carboxymuconolactone decarboxylase family protein [Zoogloeaceae bacterium]